MYVEIAARLFNAYRQSGFTQLVRSTRALELQSRGGSSMLDDLSVCYRDVPSMFFRSDYSLCNPEMFNQVLGPGSKKVINNITFHTHIRTCSNSVIKT